MTKVSQSVSQSVVPVMANLNGRELGKEAMKFEGGGISWRIDKLVGCTDGFGEK